MVYRRIDSEDTIFMSDETEEWEDSIDRELSPKFKFPITILDESMKDINLEFPPITFREPEKPKSVVSTKVIELKNTKKTKSKKGLF
jgi:hypothetical protein